MGNRISDSDSDFPGSLTNTIDRESLQPSLLKYFAGIIPLGGNLETFVNNLPTLGPERLAHGVANRFCFFPLLTPLEPFNDSRC